MLAFLSYRAFTCIVTFFFAEIINGFCISVMCVKLQLLFKLNRPFEVASRGYSFIISFSKALALHEVLDNLCLMYYCYLSWALIEGYWLWFFPPFLFPFILEFFSEYSTLLYAWSLGNNCLLGFDQCNCFSLYWRTSGTWYRKGVLPPSGWSLFTVQG